MKNIDEKKLKFAIIKLVILFLIIIFLYCISNIKIGEKRYFIMSSSISIYNDTNFDEKELSKLKWFPVLNDISYTNFYMTDINWLNELNSKVKKCLVSGSGVNKLDIKALNNTSIEFLSFSRLNIDDFSDVIDNNSINEIYAWSYDGKSFSGLENFRNLENIYIANAHNITNFDALKECSNLKSLTLIQSNVLNDYSSLIDIPKLEYLCIDDGVLSDEQLKMLIDIGVEVKLYDFNKND